MKNHAKRTRLVKQQRDATREGATRRAAGPPGTYESDGGCVAASQTEEGADMMHWSFVVVLGGIIAAVFYNRGYRTGYLAREARAIQYLLELTNHPNPTYLLQKNADAVRKLAAEYARRSDWKLPDHYIH